MYSRRQLSQSLPHLQLAESRLSVVWPHCPQATRSLASSRSRSSPPLSSSLPSQKLLQHQLPCVDDRASACDGRNASPRLLTSALRSKMSLCSKTLVTSAFDASSMCLFSFADVSNHPAKPFVSQNASKNVRSTSPERSHWTCAGVSKLVRQSSTAFGRSVGVPSNNTHELSLYLVAAQNHRQLLAVRELHLRGTQALVRSRHIQDRLHMRRLRSNASAPSSRSLSSTIAGHGGSTDTHTLSAT